MKALWNVDAVSMVIKATVRATIRGVGQVIPRVYIQSIKGIRPYEDFPCSELMQDTVDGDLACAILLCPIWPNQLVHSTSGAASYAMGVIHKRMQAALYDGVVYDSFLKEFPHNQPREWVRLDVWNEAFDSIWKFFEVCGGHRGEADPRSLFPKWMRHKGLSDTWCKAVCGFGNPEINPYTDRKVSEILSDLEMEFPQLKAIRKNDMDKEDTLKDDDWWLLCYWLLNALSAPNVTPEDTVPQQSKNGITHWFADPGDTYVNTPNMSEYRRTTPIHIAWNEIKCEQHFRPNLEAPNVTREQFPVKSWDRWQYCYAYIKKTEKEPT